MAATKGEDMESIARRVASPKGTTQAGLAVLDHDHVLDQLIALTIDAAARRGAELAEEAKSRVACRARAPVLGAHSMVSPQPPFDDRDGWIWLDGELVPWRDARIHVLTHALHYASSVFEGQRAYNGVIFKLREHSERLRRSASLLGFELPWSVEQIDAACNEVLKANGFTDAYMRPVAWRGSESMGVAPGNTKPHLAIAAWEWGKYFDPEIARNGIRLDIAPWRRPAPYTAPTESKAAGPVHDLHLVEAACRKPRI